MAGGARHLGDQEAVSRPKTSRKTSDQFENQQLGGSPPGQGPGDPHLPLGSWGPVSPVTPLPHTC